MSVFVDRVHWGGWPNCWRVANEECLLVLTSDVGPRVVHYSRQNEPNLFLEIPAEQGGCGETVFRPRGGHRLWAAPEIFPGTYYPDNGMVACEVRAGGVTLTAAREESTGLQKTLAVTLADRGSNVSVSHRLTNAHAWPVEVAAWSLTMLAPGGLGITGFPPRGTHPEVLPPTHPLVLWAFTDLTDSRWRITKKYLALRQDAARDEPTKIGHFNRDTWGAYLLGSQLFLKRYSADAACRYPDFGSSFEMFANGATLELETLSPLTHLAPGESLEHVEQWSVHEGISLADVSDETLDALMLPILRG